MTARNTPTLAEAVDARVERFLRGLNTVDVGQVESYNDDTRRATVQLVVERATIDENGERVTERRPIIVEVPVVFQGSGGRRVKFPVVAGDLVVVLFCQHSIDKWLATGGIVDPGDDRHHHMSDAIALPGLDREGEDGDAVIEFTSSGEIHVGGSAALATKADIDALKTYISTHTHSGVTTGAGVSGSPAAPPPSAAGTLITKGA